MILIYNIIMSNNNKKMKFSRVKLSNKQKMKNYNKRH